MRISGCVRPCYEFSQRDGTDARSEFRVTALDSRSNGLSVKLLEIYHSRSVE